jgi:pSer/pThr/pTyr-binding forkhead associated (FHA) protein
MAIMLSSLAIGRGAERALTRPSPTALDLRVEDSWLSKAHARLTPSGGRWLLEDEGSKTGTSVNGAAGRQFQLVDGDVILALDGTEIRSSDVLRNTIAMRKPGSTIELQVARGTGKTVVRAKLGELPNDEEAPVRRRR